MNFYRFFLFFSQLELFSLWNEYKNCLFLFFFKSKFCCLFSRAVYLSNVRSNMTPTSHLHLLLYSSEGEFFNAYTHTHSSFTYPHCAQIHIRAQCINNMKKKKYTELYTHLSYSIVIQSFLFPFILSIFPFNAQSINEKKKKNHTHTHGSNIERWRSESRTWREKKKLFALSALSIRAGVPYFISVEYENRKFITSINVSVLDCKCMRVVLLFFSSFIIRFFFFVCWFFKWM